MALKIYSKKLKKWTSQKCGYLNPKDAKAGNKGGRYLPASVRRSMTASQKAYENRKKSSQ